MLKELDKTDASILNLLLKDARQSCRKMASALGISPVTVLTRMKRLMNAGVIKGYAAVLDYEKLGYDLEVIIEVRISKGRLIDVEKRIASYPGVFAVYDHTGGFDATILGRFRNRRALDAFVKLIQSYDFVERTETKLVLNTIKEESMHVA